MHIFEVRLSLIVTALPQSDLVNDIVGFSDILLDFSSFLRLVSLKMDRIIHDLLTVFLKSFTTLQIVLNLPPAKLNSFKAGIHKKRIQLTVLLNYFAKAYESLNGIQQNAVSESSCFYPDSYD